jgi:transcriptional regulator with XRE-family HTH domain
MSIESIIDEDLSLHDYVIAQLQARKGEWRGIAEATGISRSMIVKIAQRRVKDPGVSFIERLVKYFRAQEARKAA